MTRMRVAATCVAMMALTMMVDVTSANLNVIGFDFGSTFFKVTLLQPGKGLEIVENETSLRKT